MVNVVPFKPYCAKPHYSSHSCLLAIAVEPRVYVSAGSTALLDGGNETVVATCIAERARPPAEVSWESNLFGQSEVQLFDEVNGTTSTQVRYLWQPTRHIQGHTLTCVVRHPALQTDFRIPYQLSVQCKSLVLALVSVAVIISPIFSLPLFILCTHV